jgi:hypothetical protein
MTEGLFGLGSKFNKFFFSQAFFSSGAASQVLSQCPKQFEAFRGVRRKIFTGCDLIPSGATALPARAIVCD